jgi:hypothetical protein
LKSLNHIDERRTADNSRFAKAGVLCFDDSEVLNSCFVHLMRFSAENTRLRKAAKPYHQCLKDENICINNLLRNYAHNICSSFKRQEDNRKRKILSSRPG